jgi:hypothetical protein
VSVITEQDRQRIAKDCAQAMHDVMGSGYVNDWYYSVSSDFVMVVEHWIDVVEQRLATPEPEVRQSLAETLQWRWVDGRLFDVTNHPDGSITFAQVPDRRPT